MLSYKGNPRRKAARPIPVEPTPRVLRLRRPQPGPVRDRLGLIRFAYGRRSPPLLRRSSLNALGRGKAETWRYRRSKGRGGRLPIAGVFRSLAADEQALFRDPCRFKTGSSVRDYA